MYFIVNDVSKESGIKLFFDKIKLSINTFRQDIVIVTEMPNADLSSPVGVFCLIMLINYHKMQLHSFVLNFSTALTMICHNV